MKGFSLLECLTTLFIVSILAAFSIPTIKNLTEQHKEKNLKNSIVQLINFAQQQAIIYNTSVDVRKENDYLIITTENKKLLKQKLDLAQGELIIRAFPYYRDYLKFSAAGSDNGTISYVKNHKIHWKIIVSKTGRIRLE